MILNLTYRFRKYRLLVEFRYNEFLAENSDRMVKLLAPFDLKPQTCNKRIYYFHQQFHRENKRADVLGFEPDHPISEIMSMGLRS